MASVPVDQNLDERVRRAALAEHSSISEFVRQAAADRADRILGDHATALEELQDVIGVVHSKGGRADDTGGAFRDALRVPERR